MRIRTAVLTVGVALLAVWLLGGCGGSGDSGADVPGETARYLPLAVGNSWTYNYTEYYNSASAKSRRPSPLPRRHPRRSAKAATYVENVSITGTQRINANQWYDVAARYVGADDEKRTYVRHSRDGLQSLDPELGQPVFDIKLPMQVGTTWTRRWLLYSDKTVQTSQMTITSLTAEVATTAGVFTNCLQVEDVWLESSDSDIITRWYAPGVGQVREERHVNNAATPEHLLELTEYTIPASP